MVEGIIIGNLIIEMVRARARCGNGNYNGHCQGKLVVARVLINILITEATVCTLYNLRRVFTINNSFDLRLFIRITLHNAHNHNSSVTKENYKLDLCSVHWTVFRLETL